MSVAIAQSETGEGDFLKELALLVAVLAVIVYPIVSIIRKVSGSSNSSASRRELSPEEQQRQDLWEEGREQFLEGYDQEAGRLSLGGCDQLKCSLMAFGNGGEDALEDCSTFYIWRDRDALCLFPDWYSSEEKLDFVSFHLDEELVRSAKVTAIPFEDIDYFRPMDEYEDAEILLHYRENGQSKAIRFEHEAFQFFMNWFPQKEYSYILYQRETDMQDVTEQIRALGELHEQGLLTDQEFSEKKAELLDTI